MVALKTFTNLAPERQEAIIETALKEFAANDYQTASLSVIVKNLGLAKGSFYRYFENKQSLYFYLLEYCVEKRLANDRKFITAAPNDFFELMMLHFKAKLHFDKSEKHCSAFLNRVLYEKNSPDLGNIQFIRKQRALDILQQLVEKYLQSGQLRRDIQPQLIAFHVLQTQMAIFDYLSLKYQTDFISEGATQLSDIDENEIMEAARQFISIEKSGISQ